LRWRSISERAVQGWGVSRAYIRARRSLGRTWL
jgi:hypothetical protein